MRERQESLQSSRLPLSNQGLSRYTFQKKAGWGSWPEALHTTYGPGGILKPPKGISLNTDEV